MSAEARDADRNERMQKYIDGIISVTSFNGDGGVGGVGSSSTAETSADPGTDNGTVVMKSDKPAITLGSSDSESDDSSSYSIEIKRASPLISFASNGKKTRNKWKASEDFALLRVLLDHAHLLTFVEYFKPMKKFWIKISHELNELHAGERNARQCHDRFKVLYSKALRVQDDLDEDDTYSGTLNSEAEQLLLQVRNTFTFSGGNITLKAQPAVASALPEETAAAAKLRQDHEDNTETQRQETETMQSYIFHVLSNLQEQIDLLRNHLRTTDSKTQELSNTLQNLIQALHSPPDSDPGDKHPQPAPDKQNNSHHHQAK